jgi:hypothetical protein
VQPAFSLPSRTTGCSASKPVRISAIAGAMPDQGRD